MAHRHMDIVGDHDPDADWSLPGWLYTDPEYYEVEVERVIRRLDTLANGDVNNEF